MSVWCTHVSCLESAESFACKPSLATHCQQVHSLQKLVRQTITGADDSVDHATLLAMSRQYPFVEWGCLISNGMWGKPKHPSREWYAKLAQEKMKPENVAVHDGFSVHICDDWVLALAETGCREVFEQAGKELSNCNRIQLNFTRSILSGKLNKHKLFAALFDLSWRVPGTPQPTFIFQLPTFSVSQLALVDEALAAGIQAEPFFDLSSGRGVVPESWPLPHVGRLQCFGYSGGLGPDNLMHHLGLLSEMAAGQLGNPPFHYWVDMETRVRCAQNKFDLDKCKTVLDIAKTFMRL